MSPRIRFASSHSTLRTVLFLVRYPVLPILVAVFFANVAHAELQLPAVFGDHMVLQQGQPIPVWGKANPGAKISVTLNLKTATAAAGATGDWRADLPSMPAGGPHTMTIADGKLTRVFTDVLVGEVWICSGQSNMEFPLSKANEPEAELANANHPSIRLFHVVRKASPKPLSDVEGEWKVCSPESAADFSAVGYFFGRDLARDLETPVGLIESAWGGTPARAWTERADLLAHPDLAPVVEAFDKAQLTYEEDMAAYNRELAKQKKPIALEDTGVDPKASEWMKPGLDESGWRGVELPGLLSELSLVLDGAVWFRRQIEIPAEWVGKDLELSLGAIDDFDVTYVNGVEVGRVAKETQDSWIVPRVYPIPARLVADRRLTVAVRVFDSGGDGGFSSPAELLILQKKDQREGNTLTLAGEWKCRVEREVSEKRPGGAAKLVKPIGPDDPKSPAGLFNGMIRPLIPYGIRGAIWYQGEADAGRARQYQTLFPTMIRNWRRVWGQGEFPFLYVQLANYMGRSPQPHDHQWAELREAQTMTLALPNTAMAVTIDIGNPKDIHPRNKQDVGRRLELAALATVYGREVVYSGPLYKEMKREAGAIRVSFTHVGGGLEAKGDGGLKGFAIAGADRKFVWADARIDGESVVVSSPGVVEPVAVRYAWDSNPECNLYNKAGLPASPFRTDTWPGVTDNAR